VKLAEYFLKQGQKPGAHSGERAKRQTEKALDAKVSRRKALKIFGQGAAAATVAASTSGCSGSSGVDFGKFFKTHYQEMTAEQKEAMFKRLKDEARAKHGIEIEVKDPQPQPGVHFAFCLNLSVCDGNRACVHACVEENNQSRDPAIQYIKVLEMDRGSFNLEHGDQYFDHKELPQKDKFYLPVQCNQCDNPPCVSACPVQATWKESDGIVVIDYDWCIGCRYCMAACPYEARRFNFSEPRIAAHEVNPNQGVLSNRVRPRGVVEKCHFCLHRTRNGDYPACLEACPTGARKFGNLNDPTSEVAQIIKHKNVFVLKEELNTKPSFFYYFD
jgi:molybdopterin-containing oxidoreductase family iron-sulfur binding subunit